MKPKDIELSLDLRMINITENDLDKSIYRIFSMKRLIEMFADRKLYLPKVNSWEDVYENFFLKSNFTNEGYDIIGLKKDSELYFGQCWCFIEDSDAMWRIYSHEKQSIRLKTTMRKLFATVASMENCGIIMDSGLGPILDTFIGVVNYKSKEELDVWKKEQIIKMEEFESKNIESLFIKRDNFKHESEVRVIYCAEESDSKIKPDSIVPLVGFKINPHEFIEEIAFDPRADDSYFKAFKEYLINELKIPGNKITKSKLYDFESFTFIVT